MKNFVNLYFMTLLILICVTSACCKKDKCEGIKCAGGDECNEGKCDCPEGKVKVGDICIVLAENQYYSTTRCRCLDTFTMNIDLPQFPDPTDKTLHPFNFYFARKSGTNIGGNYYKKAKGDSIFVRFGLFSRFDPTACDLKGFPSYPAFSGIIDTLKKEINGKIYWYNDAFGYKHPVDSCKITLHK